VIGVGKLLAAAEEAAVLLAAEGIDVTVWDPRVVSPPDPVLLADAAAHDLVVTAEDGLRFGGAGMFLTDAIAAWADGEGRRPPAFANLGIPRTYVPQGRADDLLAELGLDGAGLAASVRRLANGIPVRLERPHTNVRDPRSDAADER
jgi:1-deoxy-D-xylulose-5-phosphate synthase